VKKFILYTQSLCQARICRADHALTPSACTITVVLLRCFLCYETQLLQTASRNPHGPCDFYVFPKMKLRLKGRCFASIEEVQAESQQILNTLMSADFNECFQKWQNRWDRCIQAPGDYFEGDSGN